MTGKHEVSKTLRRIASLLEIAGESPFKISAFRKGAKSIDLIEEPLEDWVRSRRIDSTSGIGKTLGPIIEEIVKTGRSEYLSELETKHPPALLDLSRLPGLGPKKIADLRRLLGVSSLADLEQVCREDKLRTLPGFGEKVQAEILERLETLRTVSVRLLLPQALEISEAIAARVRLVDSAARVEIAGETRRRLEIVDRIDVCVGVEDPEEFLDRVWDEAFLDSMDDAGPSRIRGVLGGQVRVEIMAVRPDCFGAALLVHTGCDTFVEAARAALRDKGLELEEDGVRRGKKSVDTSEEAELFRLMDRPVVEPELREFGEALAHVWPHLIEQDHLRGAFHVHSTWSDGRNTLSEMLHAAKERGFSYVGISDHSKSATYAGGLDEMRLDLQRAELSNLRERVKPMRVFYGTEADILGDGSIDYDDATLDRFDFVVASIHSRFKMNASEMTDRMVKALTNPHVTFLGHMTGRLLLARDGYSLDYDRVFAAAAENGVIIEINGSPKRLDIDWRLMRRAIDRGVLLSIHPDAHEVSELDWVRNGIWAARKGGVTRNDVFNTRTLSQVEKYLAKRRERRVRGAS